MPLTTERNNATYAPARAGNTGCRQRIWHGLFRRDSVYLQGYLKGYDPRLGFDSGILYLSNEITRKDYPTVVPINPDGSFECKFILSYPVCQNLTLNNQWIPFYAEPGDTVTMYLDWEDIMARSRARDNKYPLIHTAYMGKTAALSYLTVTLNDLIDYPYEKLNKAQKTLTPAQFQKQLEPYTARWQQQADSLCRLYATSQKAVSLIRNHTAIKAGEIYFDYQMPRSLLCPARHGQSGIAGAAGCFLLRLSETNAFGRNVSTGLFPDKCFHQPF